VPQQYSKQTVTTLGMGGGTRATGDGSPSAAALIVGHGIRGGWTSSSRVTLVKGIHRGGEHDTDAAHGVVRLAAVALPWIGRRPSQ
jgi:hypothetical protein